MSDTLLQVLQAVFPEANSEHARVLREMDGLLSASFDRLTPFSSAAALRHGLSLSASLGQATNTSLGLHFEHDCL